MIFVYSNKRIIPKREDTESFREKFFLFLSHDLESFDANIRIKDNSMEFIRKRKISNPSGKNVSELFKILRAGEIKLIESSNDELLIQYKVNVFRNFIVSQFVGIIITVLVNFYIVISILIALCVFIFSSTLVYMVWLLVEKRKIDSIIDSAISCTLIDN